MSKTLNGRYLIPFDSGIIFSQWLPDSENEFLVRQKGNIKARLWIDKSCLDNLEEDISQYAYVSVNKAYVNIEITDVSEELTTFIFNERESPRNIYHGIDPMHEDYSRLKKEYIALGSEVIKIVLKICNRFIDFARNHKSQYWLNRYPYDENYMQSMNNNCQVKVSSEDYDWVRWCPLGEEVPRIFYLPDEKTLIKREEWKEFQEFVASDSRPNLIEELLANAQLLMTKGHRRSAIIEACTALEIAVSEFSKNGKLDKLVTDELCSRFDTKKLQAQIKHLGFSGSVKFLLPILFSSEILSTDILKHCQELIDLRNNVVHNKQRDVDERKARSLIAGSRQMCKIITRYIE